MLVIKQGGLALASTVNEGKYAVLTVALVANIVFGSLEAVPYSECLVCTSGANCALSRTEAHVKDSVLVARQLTHFGQSGVAPHCHLVLRSTVSRYQCPVFPIPS